MLGKLKRRYDMKMYTVESLVDNKLQMKEGILADGSKVYDVYLLANQICCNNKESAERIYEFLKHEIEEGNII
jgi:hypothetical protein